MNALNSGDHIDFTSDENIVKWKGVLIVALKKVMDFVMGYFCMISF